MKRNSAASEAMDELAEVIGWRGAARMAAWLGGKTIHIPQKPDEGHALSRILGHEEALQVGAMMGGEDIELPSTGELQEEMEAIRRDAMVCEMAAEGVAVRTIARWARVGRPTIRNILRDRGPVIEALKRNAGSPEEATA